MIGDEWKFAGVGDWNHDANNELLFKGCASSLKPETDEYNKILGAGKIA